MFDFGWQLAGLFFRASPPDSADRKSATLAAGETKSQGVSMAGGRSAETNVAVCMGQELPGFGFSSGENASLCPAFAADKPVTDYLTNFNYSSIVKHTSLVQVPGFQLLMSTSD